MQSVRTIAATAPAPVLETPLRGWRAAPQRAKLRICAIGLRAMPGTMGGIETHCENLYPRLADIDQDLEVVVLARAPYVERNAEPIPGVRVVPIWSLRHKCLETLLHTLTALLYARLFVRPDIVHLHAVGPAFFTPLARLLGFKTVVTHHSADYLRPKWGLLGRAFLRSGEIMAALFANRIVCVNASLRADLVRRFPFASKRICMIRNGAPLPNFRGENVDQLLSELGVERGKYVLAVGRLEATKGFHDLIAAFKRAHPEGVKLVIVGADFSTDAYAHRLRAQACSDIAFAGFRNGAQLWALYRHAGVFIHPSYMEGFSLVTLEALAAGAPVLLSDIPANREFNLENDCYFPVGDVDALAVKLSQGPWRPSPRALKVLHDNNWDEAARRLGGQLRKIVRRRLH